MLPRLEIGPWQFSTYILFYVLATLVGCAFVFFRLSRLEIPAPFLFRAVSIAILAGFACAYLVRLVPTIQRYLQSGVWDWVGGSSFVGGLLGGMGVMVLYCRQLSCRQHSIPVSRVLDQIAPPLALALAIGRLGCFAAGCCYGRPTDGWPGIFLPDNQGDWAVRYPTQPLSAAANLLIMALLLGIEQRQKKKRGEIAFDGFLILLFLDLYFLQRFAIEFLRADSIPVLGPISWAQFYTVVGMVVVTAWLVWKKRLSGSQPYHQNVSSR